MADGARRGNDPVVVIGAGVAGLACAAGLVAANQPVIVLEAGDGPGGRVRTDVHPDGFLLDRGFQVILDAYPALNRQLDLAALRPGKFESGAMLWNGRRLMRLANPFRHPRALLQDVTTDVIPLKDKARIAKVGAQAGLAKWGSAADAAGPDDRPVAESLAAAGFSQVFIDRFARPFWGGISLDRSLLGSSGPFRFTLKMFLQGSAVLPEAGVGAVPVAMERRIPYGAVRYGQRVEAVVIEGGKAVGVRVNGETLPASAVVVAVDAPEARRLTAIEAIPTRGLPCVTVTLAGRRDPGVGRALVLDSTGTLAVNHIAPLSAVQPGYAPNGEHLISAVLLGEGAAANPDDDELARLARRDAAEMLGGEQADWRTIDVSRIPFAQYAQPPGIHGRLPGTVTQTPGLFLAGEITVDSSLNGAIISGERAAAAVLAMLRVLAKR